MEGFFFCATCQSPSTNCCSRCRTVYYCSRQHQKNDWVNHKLVCGPSFKINETEAEGRYLVASRLIKAGELILQELPLVIGPKLATQPLCLGCYKPVNGLYRCSRCQWPLCSADCERHVFHANGECRLIDPKLVSSQLRPGAIHPQVYQCISPLRYLSLPATDHECGDKLVSHLEQRRNTDLYRLVEQNISSYLRNQLKLIQFDSERIQRVCGILDTNCFEIRLRDRVSIRGLYPNASLMNHECVANTRHVFNPFDFRIKVIATRDIAPGQTISATYTQSLWNTLDRRWHLKSTKHFWCHCRRCADPQEFGTWLSAIRCDRCGNLISSQNSLDVTAKWRCTNCETILDADKVNQIHHSVRAELRKIATVGPDRLRLLEEFVDKYSALIHPGSCHIIEAKYALVQLYGNTVDLRHQDLSNDQLKKKMDYCRQLLKLADLIEPQLSPFRGQLLFELQVAMEHHIIKNFKPNSSEFRKLMKESAEIFEESANILRHESDWSDSIEKRRSFFKTYIS